MKALVLDGGTVGGADGSTAVAVEAMTEVLRDGGFEVDSVRPADLDIAPCRGCFGCWTRSPGECVIHDDASDALRRYMASDLVAFVTPVTFGGFSSGLKRFIDRFIPIVDPRFTTTGGNTHHVQRYGHYPTVLGLGLLETPDDEAAAVFARLIDRFGREMEQWRGQSAVLVGLDADDARRAATALLANAEVAV